MEFREALDKLGERVTHDEVAEALGVSVASVRQYTLAEEARAHRSPPAGGPEVLSRLARARGEELIELAQALQMRKERR
jgi:hypothetical protein